MGERDGFKSRMGFLLVSAGCAIGIGNVWKFPYIAGQYGGRCFCAVLPGIFSAYGDSRHDDGAGGRTRQPPKRGARL